MTYNFCTLFDSYYLPRGIILHDSISRVCSNFHLFVFAFDDQCYRKLTELNLPNMTVISLKEFETEELLAVKGGRTRAEYCWTCSPSIIWHAIHHFDLDHCTYIDADLLFFNTPKIAFDEIENARASIAITEHFTKENNELAGRFCVQFTYFKNDKDGIEALNWWRNSCIEWCFARYDDGKFGDQKYLDYFPEMFKNVLVFKNRGVGVAPWNMDQYQYLDNYRFSYKGEEYPVVFFHYHGVTVNIEETRLILKPVTFDITEKIEKIFFFPFLMRYKEKCNSYFNTNLLEINIEKRKWHERKWAFVKTALRNNKTIQSIYYRFIAKRHTSHEKISILN